jgi:hypothetical protein
VSLSGASLAVATAREEVAQANERRYRFPTWVAATDRCLWLLEGLNLADVATVPHWRLVEVRRLLATLPREYRPGFADGVRTQAALDAVFDVQELLFRLREPEPAKARVPDTFDAEEMDQWEAVCEWLADQGEGVPCADVDRETADQLEVMRRLLPAGLVCVARGTCWRVWPTWRRRLAAMRAGERER